MYIYIYAVIKWKYSLAEGKHHILSWILLYKPTSGCVVPASKIIVTPNFWTSRYTVFQLLSACPHSSQPMLKPPTVTDPSPTLQ